MAAEKAVATTNLYAKLATIAAKLGAIKKDGEAPAVMGGFKFISHAALMGHLRNELKDANVAIVPLGTRLLADEAFVMHTKSGDRDARRVVVESRYCVVNGDDPSEHFESIWIGEGIDTADKAIQKAATSADKYFLFKLFKVSDQDDPDGAEVEGEVRVVRPQPAPTPAPTNGNGFNLEKKLAESVEAAHAERASRPTPRTPTVGPRATRPAPTPARPVDDGYDPEQFEALVR